MKNFFSNFFGRNHKPESIINFDVLDSIYSYLYNEKSRFEFKMKDIHNKVLVTLHSIPNSFDCDQGRNEIERLGFKNSYEVLNELYKKIDIDTLSDKDIEEGLEYDYIHVQFYSESDSEMKEKIKYVLENFIIFFCCTNSCEVNDFKILHTNNYFWDYTKGLLTAEYIDLNEPKNEIQKKVFDDFQIVLQGICQYLKIELPENVIQPTSENLMLDEVSIGDFKEFMKLISRGGISDELLESQSQKLYTNFGKDEEEDEEEFDYFEGISSWSSDWKFDPEDVICFISEILEEEFNFDYPEETYSHDLFPYIQKELGKQNLELMSYDTNADSYLFFIVNKKDKKRILELSQLIEIPIVVLQ